MRPLLDYCGNIPQSVVEAGEILLQEGERSGRMYVLVDGAIEVFRGDVEIAFVTEPGSVFGEMSVLLNLPHTASVRAAEEARVHVIDNALEFLRDNPGVTLPIASLLARRLQSATNYLVNLKQQFQDYKDHFGMVDEVLESLTHQQNEDFVPASDLPPDP